MEMLLKEGRAVKIDVVVADDEETRLVGGLSLRVIPDRLFGHHEPLLPALVDHVAGVNGE